MQPKATASVLFIITGIALIVLGAFSALESLTSIINFLSLYSSMSPYLSLDVFPWPQTVFSILTGALMIVAGILALVFARQPQKSSLVLVFALIAGACALIELALQFFRIIGTIANYGGDYFGFSSTVFFGLLPAPLPAVHVFYILAGVLGLAAAVVLCICAILARSRARGVR
jgi:hypothetical protein